MSPHWALLSHPLTKKRVHGAPSSMVFDGRYFETLWLQYLRDPSAIPEDWRNAFHFISAVYGDPFAQDPKRSLSAPEQTFAEYLRRFGHLHAKLDPLGIAVVPALPSDLSGGGEPASGLLSAHTDTLAVETGHLDDPEMRDWVLDEFEAIQLAERMPDPAVFDELIATELFDRFLGAKYPGKKRFGSEGADAILPLLHGLRRDAAEAGTDELIVGSMHRGRLSVLHNFAGMNASRLFALLHGEHPFPDRTDLPGDVPYHFGHTSEQDGLRITMLPNPSHLEAVNPVVIGFARARRTEGSGRAMAVIVHTDASVIGQGVNAELLQMSALPGFTVGGTLHIVINNQIGFTTDPGEARSSRYCTGLWRAVDSLLLHVNGDDVDAVLRAVSLAVRFRARFARDVVIDLVCYRANGHNEIDEPRFTQPTYYRAADNKRGVAEIYERRLIERGLLTEDEIRNRRVQLTARLEAAYVAPPPAEAPVDELISNFVPAGITESDLREIIAVLANVPDDAGMPKLIKLMERRLDEIESGISWPLAEAMAFAATLRTGMSVRVCGQDFERGPFSQRHLAAIDPETGARQHPMAALARHGAKLEVVNSPLSEYAVLGFEYGYSLGSAGALCVWEAQFGDFANGAQIMIDQFIASGFEKWRQTSGLVVLLPHGLEGQGPEHSSARIERLLQLCARDNITVAHPSTPANYFHLLREQATRVDRPLFIVTPKVLLRLPQARSRLDDFASDAGFRPVVCSIPTSKAVRAVICSGKIAYELEKLRDSKDVAVVIIRLERLYPFPRDQLVDRLRESGISEMLWLQEEPENYGAGVWLQARLLAVAAPLGVTLLPMVARPESASPAGSFHMWHVRDQERLLHAALGVDHDDGQ